MPIDDTRSLAIYDSDHEAILRNISTVDVINCWQGSNL